MMHLAALLTALTMGQTDGIYRQGPVTLQIQPAPEREVVSLPAPDELTITIRVEGSDKLEVKPPSRWISSRPWRIQPPGPAKIEKTEGKSVWEQVLHAYPSAPGEFSLVFAPIAWKDGDLEGEAKFPPISVRSFSTLQKADLRNLRDPVWIEPLPNGPPRRPWLNIALTGFGVSVGLFLALRGMRRRPKGSKHSSEERALRALDRIDGWRLPEQGKGERYFALLSLVVRRYLERKHQLPARHRTSQDLLDLLANREDLVAEREFLARFAEQADRAKFGATPPSPEECSAAQQSVRAWLQSRPALAFRDLNQTAAQR